MTNRQETPDPIICPGCESAGQMPHNRIDGACTMTHYVIMHSGPRDADSFNVGDWNCFQDHADAMRMAAGLQMDLELESPLLVVECTGEKGSSDCYGHRFANITDCPHIMDSELR